MMQFIEILIVHWFADFIMQTRWMANNKSKDIYALLTHVLVYSLIWSIFIFIMYESIIFSILFFIITINTHFITDFITSKITSYYYNKQNYYMFFAIIGLDQILHYVQLLLTYNYLQL